MTYPKTVRVADTFIADEFRRIPPRVLQAYRNLNIIADLRQELYLGYFLAEGSLDAIKRSMHAAAERFRYRELTRPARRSVPFDNAPLEIQLRTYGEASAESHARELIRVA